MDIVPLLWREGILCKTRAVSADALYIHADRNAVHDTGDSILAVGEIEMNVRNPFYPRFPVLADRELDITEPCHILQQTECHGGLPPA